MKDKTPEELLAVLEAEVATDEGEPSEGDLDIDLEKLRDHRPTVEEVFPHWQTLFRRDRPWVASTITALFEGPVLVIGYTTKLVEEGRFTRNSQVWFVDGERHKFRGLLSLCQPHRLGNEDRRLEVRVVPAKHVSRVRLWQRHTPPTGEPDDVPGASASYRWTGERLSRVRD